MAAYFSGTINALKRGITKMTVSAAVRNIENWEENLAEVEVSGCRAVLRDLGTLKKQLQEDEPDGERIRHLIARLASQTISVSEKADARYRDKIADLGEMLADAAESAEADDNEDNTTSYRSQSPQRGSTGSSSRDDDQDDERRRGADTIQDRVELPAGLALLLMVAHHPRLAQGEGSEHADCVERNQCVGQTTERNDQKTRCGG